MNRNLGQKAQSLIAAIKEIQNDFTLVQGAGGNCSVKDDDSMLIKASGKKMSESGDEDFLYEVNLRNGVAPQGGNSRSGKPSIELPLHLGLEHEFVLHLHSEMAVVVAATLGGSEEGKQKLADYLDAEVVDYYRPGSELSAAVSTRSGSKKKDPCLFLLANHGLLIGARTTSDLLITLKEFEKKSRDLLGIEPSEGYTPNVLDKEIGHQEAETIKWHMMTNWRITPDHVVFLGPRPSPKILSLFSAPGTIKEVADLFPVGNMGRAQFEQLLWFANVALKLPRQQIPTLSVREAGELSNWELEKYRVKMMSGNR